MKTNLIELKSIPDSEKDEVRIPLFTLDGVEYTINTNPKVNVALKYMRMCRTDGIDIAAGWLVEQLVGEDAYEALMNFEDLTPEQLESIMTAAQNIVAGSMTNPKDN